MGTSLIAPIQDWLKPILGRPATLQAAWRTRNPTKSLLVARGLGESVWIFGKGPECSAGSLPPSDNPPDLLQQQPALPPQLALPVAAGRPRLRERALEALALGQPALPLGSAPLGLPRPRLRLGPLPVALLHGPVEVARLALLFLLVGPARSAVCGTGRGRRGFVVVVVVFVFVDEHGLPLWMDLRRWWWWLARAIIILVLVLFLFPVLVLLLLVVVSRAVLLYRFLGFRFESGLCLGLGFLPGFDLLVCLLDLGFVDQFLLYLVDCETATCQPKFMYAV